MKKQWETLIQEVDKCVLLCVRCHFEVEDGMVDLSVFSKEGVTILKEPEKNEEEE